MDEFELEIEDGDRRISFPAQLLMMGYTHKIQVEVQGVQVLFEPDEERNYRAVVPGEYRNKIDVGVLEKLAIAIEKAVT
jgi:hypothetical protein